MNIDWKAVFNSPHCVAIGALFLLYVMLQPILDKVPDKLDQLLSKVDQCIGGNTRVSSGVTVKKRQVD